MKNPLTSLLMLFMTTGMLTLGSCEAFSQAEGTEGPDFEVDLQGGGTFKLSDQAGKVVLVFFFGNNCPSCKAVGPSVESQIFQEYKDNEAFTAIGLDTWDSSSSEASVSGFRSSTGISFPLAIKAGFVAGDYGMTYDRLMVIDHNGVIVHKGSVLASNDLNNAKSAVEESLIATGIDSPGQKSRSVQVYPVPAANQVTFEAGERLGEIRIFDVSGRLVLEDSKGSAAGERSISVEELENGPYFYKVRVGSEMVSGKLFIEN